MSLIVWPNPGISSLMWDTIPHMGPTFASRAPAKILLFVYLSKMATSLWIMDRAGYFSQIHHTPIFLGAKLFTTF